MQDTNYLCMLTFREVHVLKRDWLEYGLEIEKFTKIEIHDQEIYRYIMYLIQHQTCNKTTLCRNLKNYCHQYFPTRFKQ